MVQQNVERLIGRLATDPALRKRFSRNAAAVLTQYLERGVELTRIELEALASIDSRALQAFTATLDERLQRLDP